MLAQILAVTGLNLRTIPVRLGTSMVIVVGIGGVVGVLVALLAMAEGFKATLASTGRPDRVLMLRAGSNDELASVMSIDNWAIVREFPGIRKDAAGQPVAIAERYLLTDVKRRGADTGSNVVVRGTTPDVLRVRPETKIVAGRMFEAGKREVIVGAAALDQYQGLEIGRNVEVRDGDWPVVGIFATGGDVHESELWVDVTTLQSALRTPVYGMIMAQLVDATPETFQAFKDRITTDPRLNLGVQREPDYYASRSEALQKFITGLGYSVAVIMAIGAFFGALNTMYAAVSSRAVEIATLRAIGFQSAPVFVSVVAEALFLAILGGMLGAAFAYVVFNGYTVSTLNFQTFSQVAFAFRVTPGLIGEGLTWAVLIGFIGALLPAAKFSGDIFFRYWSVLVSLVLALLGFRTLLALRSDSAVDALRPIAIAIPYFTVMLALGYVILRWIVAKRRRGQLQGRWGRIGLTVLFIPLGLVMAIAPGLFLLRALWARHPELLVQDPILEGLRQA